MALQRRTLISGRLAPTLGRAAGYLADLLVWSALVSLLELVRPYAIGDGADLVAIGVLTFFGLAVSRAARADLLPATRRFGLLLRDLGRAVLRRLAPKYAVAFRRSEGVVPLPDRALLGVLTVGAVVAMAFTAAGGSIFTALAYCKAQISYSLYLVGLASIWACLAGVLVMGAISGAQWVQQAESLPRSRVRVPRRLVIAVGWIVGMVVLALVPGLVSIGLVAGVGLVAYAGLSNAPATPYIFCRRDALGRPRFIPVEAFLRRAYLTLLAVLTAVVAMGQAGRLLESGWPNGPFALTQAIGQLATLAALMLLVRAAMHLTRLTGGDTAPEIPLDRTVWVREDVAQPDAWRAAAGAHDFRIVDAPQPPREGFDLVVGDPAHPQRLEPRPEADREALGWQVLRRFHVVMRRRFYKRMKRLMKALAAADTRGGSGYLFCPHAWLVHGVVRDVDVTRRGSGSLVGPGIVGPMFQQVFSPRTRRYLGDVFRALQVDIVFFEDAIRWPDLKRVFGVAFEIYDQQRGPALPRHFVGIPRVRVLVQEEPAEADPMPEQPHPTPAPGHVRVLVILRDRGGEEEPITPAPPSGRRREPTLIA
ncbi:MAG: hypothetical protein QNJ98_04500 [Planctomycetota bacterium]|nr:hypothetical protein [Planctomycetota bacterium]